MAPRGQRGLLEVRALDFGLLEPIDLGLEAGECVSLWGPSGSGKTRLLRALADLDPHRGQVWLDGVARTSMPAHLWRRRVALLPAEPVFWEDTVGQHFELAPSGWFEALGFPPGVLDWRVSRLSTGEKQRLGLLRLLSIEPRAVLLDEPTANLDEDTTARVEKFLAARIGEGLAALWVSHDPRQRARVSHRQYEIRGGKLEAAGRT